MRHAHFLLLDKVLELGSVGDLLLGLECLEVDLTLGQSSAHGTSSLFAEVGRDVFFSLVELVESVALDVRDDGLDLGDVVAKGAAVWFGRKESERERERSKWEKKVEERDEVHLGNAGTSTSRELLDAGKGELILEGVNLAFQFSLGFLFQLSGVESCCGCVWWYVRNEESNKERRKGDKPMARKEERRKRKKRKKPKSKIGKEHVTVDQYQIFFCFYSDFCVRSKQHVGLLVSHDSLLDHRSEMSNETLHGPGCCISQCADRVTLYLKRDLVQLVDLLQLCVPGNHSIHQC